MIAVSIAYVAIENILTAELKPSRLALVFGIALALTLDEFALWLRLADVYWSPEGIESMKASAIVAALLGLYSFGHEAWHNIAREMLRD